MVHGKEIASVNNIYDSIMANKLAFPTKTIVVTTNKDIVKD